MTIILFLIDTSGSMNQRINSGAKESLLDIAKETVERFMKIRQRDTASRLDRYMLLTFEDLPYNIKAGWKESHAVFMNELKNLNATGLTTIHTALRNSFDYLNLNRMQNAIDCYGLGRHPYFIEPAVIILITDGGKYLTQNNVQKELIIPPSNCPGSEFAADPYRWDQRLFSIVLRISGQFDSNNSVTNVPLDHSPVNGLCENTGGRSFSVTSRNEINWSIDYLLSRMHSGVIAKFEKFGPDPPMIINEETENGKNNPDNLILNNNRSWQNCRTMILVKSNNKGYSVGHWPIPESYWHDANVGPIPPRLAHPVIKFTCTNSEPTVIENLPFDKYELDPSPLTQFILARKQPNFAWQVFVANSQRNSELGQPFGYLKASTNLTCVNLFVLPYNYPVLLPLLEELFKQLQCKPTREWRQQFENYLKGMPIYYAGPLKKALQKMNPHLNLIPETLDLCATSFSQTLIKKNRNLAKIELEKLISSMGQHQPPEIEWPRITTNQSSFTYQPRKYIAELFCSNPSLQRTFSRRSYEFKDFNGFIVHYKDKPVSENKNRFCRTPEQISRHELLDQVSKLREIFFQKSLSKIKSVDEDQLYHLPIAQMGNFAEYLKNKPVGLREMEPSAQRVHTFGNPFKLNKKNETMMIDETDNDDNDGNNNNNNNNSNNIPRGMKRSASDSSLNLGQLKWKRKAGPIPKDFVFKSSQKRFQSQSLPSSPVHHVVYQPPLTPQPKSTQMINNSPFMQQPLTPPPSPLQTPPPSPSLTLNSISNNNNNINNNHHHHIVNYINPMIDLGNQAMMPQQPMLRYPAKNLIRIPVIHNNNNNNNNGNGNGNNGNFNNKPPPYLNSLTPPPTIPSTQSSINNNNNQILPNSISNNTTIIINSNNNNNDKPKMMNNNNSNNIYNNAIQQLQHHQHQSPFYFHHQQPPPPPQQPRMNMMNGGGGGGAGIMMNQNQMTTMTMNQSFRSQLNPQKGLNLTKIEQETLKKVLHYVRMKDQINLFRIIKTEKDEFSDYLLHQAIFYANRFEMQSLLNFLRKTFGKRAQKVFDLIQPSSNSSVSSVSSTSSIPNINNNKEETTVKTIMMTM